jgi:hypothetical protein
MRYSIGNAIRLVTGLTLLILFVDVVRGHEFVRVLAAAEIAAAAAFCLPGVWRIGGAGVLAILGFAFTHHAIAGHFASPLLFAALVILLLLTYERS